MLGRLTKFIKLIQLFHSNMTRDVQSDGEPSMQFSFSKGVRELDLSVYVRYCLDGSLFNLCKLTARTKILVSLILKEDTALLVATCNSLKFHWNVLVKCFSQSKLFQSANSLVAIFNILMNWTTWSGLVWKRHFFRKLKINKERLGNCAVPDSSLERNARNYQNSGKVSVRALS